MDKVLGIDFGTTNSCMAIWEKGEVVIIPNAEGMRITPSVIAVNKDGDILIGELAKRQAVTNPKNTVFSIKRLLGRKYSEVKDNLIDFPFEISNGKNDEINIVLDKKSYTPQQIVALILKKLKNDAELYLGEAVERVVITVPAYFDDQQRQATYDAGTLADIEVLALLNEPSSAALAYNLEKNSKGIFAVYDLGGGTFDISILELDNNNYKVLATKGDTKLGGVDFDKVIIDFLVKNFIIKYNIDLKKDPQALQRLTDVSEKAKCDLSSTQSTEINLPFISANDSGPLHLSESLSRNQLEELTISLIERTKEPLLDVVEELGLSLEGIENLLLVGGMTRMPRIVKELKNILKIKILQSINPDEVVACGAAIHGASITGAIEDLLFLDVIPISLGVETAGGVCTKLINKNTTIPTQANDVFTTEDDNQSTVTINILQGEGDLVVENKSIGHFVLSGIEPAPKGTPHIEVTFDIDSNGILNVSAVDLKTGKSEKIKISSSSKLSKTEINRMKALIK